MRILFLGDLHCGHYTGLTPPDWWHNDFTVVQKPLWKWYVKTLKEIGKVDVAVINGDAVDGEGKKGTLGHITTNTEKQGEIAIECIDQIKTDKHFFTYGTAFHVTGTYDYENKVAQNYNALIKETLMLSFKGHKFNIRHHGGRSDTPYGQGTQIFKEAIRDLINAQHNEYQDAQFVVRSHVHYYYMTQNATKTAISLPCLQVSESVFGRKCRPMFYDLGLVVAEIGKDVVFSKHIMRINRVLNKDYLCVK